MPVQAWAVALLLGRVRMATRGAIVSADRGAAGGQRVGLLDWQLAAGSWTMRNRALERAVQNVEGTVGVESVSQEWQTTVTAQVAEDKDLSR